jgi:hypothetical protein
LLARAGRDALFLGGDFFFCRAIANMAEDNDDFIAAR